MSPPLLWQHSFSNFNEKARRALDFKQIRHRRHSLLPGGSRAMAFSHGDGTIPVLDLDGERVLDSTRIVEALELEDFFDEHTGLPRRLALDEPALRLQRGGRRAQPGDGGRGG